MYRQTKNGNTGHHVVEYAVWVGVLHGGDQKKREPKRKGQLLQQYNKQIDQAKRSCKLGGSNPCLSREWRLKPPP